MNFDQMIRYTAMLCGNLKSGHPLYKYVSGDTSSATISVVNDAAKRFVRMIPERLPEMEASWTAGPTVAGTNSLSLPGDILIVYEVKEAHQATLPDWNTTRTYPVSFVEPDVFDILAKDTTVTGYPVLCTKIGKVIKVWPTPSALTVSYMHWFGIMQETTLVNPGDSFFMNPDWHPTVCKLAASLVEEMRGNFDRAKALLGAVKDELSTSKDIVGQENLKSSDTISVAGAPTRATVHGR